MIAHNNDGDTVVDDGLSLCDYDDEEQGGTVPMSERLTHTQADTNRRLAKQYKRFTLSLLFVTFLVSVVVVTVRTYGNTGRRSPSSQSNGEDGGGLSIWDIFFGNGHTEEVNKVRLQQTLDYLMEHKISNPDTLLDQTMRSNEMYAYLNIGTGHSPQYEAALWIANIDKARMKIPTTTDDVSPSKEEEEDDSLFSNNNDRSDSVVSYDYPFIQRYSLAVLFFATGGDSNWYWKMNFLSGIHECGWYDKFSVQGYNDKEFIFGVMCDGLPDWDDDDDIKQKDVWDGQRMVTGISLPPKNNMVGTLPPEVHHLRYLKVLHVQQNLGIEGSIPFQYGWLKHLTALALISNNLSGKIPRTFDYLTKLEILRLEENQLSGDSTEGDLDFLQEMTSLRQLTLDYNPQITGTLPDFISKLTKLEKLSVSDTNMYGTLPPSLAELTELKSLYIDDCAFEGSISMVSSSLPNLTHVHLEDNWFNDTIDDKFFATSKNLVQLDVSNCSFSGTVPGHLFNLSQLQVLDMSMNELSGDLPAETISAQEESNLVFLSLHTNKLTGYIPSSIGNFKNLRTLDLSINKFSGDIPSEIGKLSNLEILFLGRNEFNESEVPVFIQNLTNLKELSLKNASITGNIPTWLGNISKLTFLDLGENALMGSIPQSLGKLSELMVLILNSNYLKGQLGLGQLTQLETLLIDDNALSGNTDDMCQHEITHFVSDCATTSPDIFDAEIQCSCCTLCCSDENVTCNDSEWLGNHGGIWETGYNRLKWEFGDNGMISPLVNYNILQ